MRRPALYFAVALVLVGTAKVSFSQRNTLIDKQASRETRALYANLSKIAKRGILFGHQHATEYGHGWMNDPDRSDVKSVTGSHPAVIGVDFSGLSGRPDSLLVKTADALGKTITDTYKRGGITTIAWHFPNPISPGGFYWVDSVSLPAVRYLIPGGEKNEQYKLILRRIGELLNSLKGEDGKMVPVIFRPYHEMDGSWFWWGRAHCTPDDFKSLWRFTVSYLRDSLKVHNVIYAFSPDCTFNTEQQYLERYPGDEWTDMIGMDDYADFGRDGKYNLDAGVRKLQIIGNYAKRSGKLAAFTETGLESIPDSSWWTEKLLKTIKRSRVSLAYVLVWRNDSRSATHYYAPYPGQTSVPDFIKFYQDPFTIFEKDLRRVYR